MGIKHILFILLIPIIVQSCATLDTPTVLGTLNQSNLVSLNGIYDNKPLEVRNGYVCSLSDVFYQGKNMFNMYSDKRFESDNIKVELQILSDKLLHVRFIEMDTVIQQRCVKVELKHDGYLYIQGRKFKIYGFPLLFGGWNVQKSRINIDHQGGMYVQSNYFICNGAVIVMTDWSTRKFNLTFDKQ